MKTAYLFDENNQLICPITPAEFRLMTEEEKKFVKCGHCNPISSERCYGDVEIRSRFVQSTGKMTDYFVSFNHIKNCEAARSMKKKITTENFDPDGNDIDVSKLFKKFTSEIKERGPRPVPPPKGPAPGGDGGDDGGVETIDIIEKVKTTPDLKSLVRLLLEKQARETYGGKKVFNLIIDGQTVSEHKIGSLQGDRIVIAYPQKLFYDKHNGKLNLFIRDAKNQNRVIHFQVYFKFQRLFDKLVAEQFDPKGKRLDLPIALIGSLENISSPNEESYCVLIKNMTAAFTVNGEMTNSCHNPY